MDFPNRQFRHSMATLGGIIALLLLSLWAWPDSSPAVEAPPPVTISVDDERIVVSADRSAGGVVPSAKGTNENTDYGRISVYSPTFQHRGRFQHILRSTPRDHGLAPEKSHEADVSMK